MKNIKRTVTQALEISEEIILDLPLITLIGREKLIVENYKGIIEYGDKTVRINTGAGILKIEGDKLLLKNITSESINVTGVISRFEYIV